MLKDHAFRDPSILFPPPAQKDTITVHEAISTLAWRKTAWVVGKPKFTPGKQKLFFTACQTCKRQLDCPMEWVIECSECGEKSGVEYWSRVKIQLTEGDDSLFVTIKSPDVERLTKVTPQHLRDSDEFLNVEQELKEELEKLTVVCFLRRNQNKKQETEDSEIVTYAAVKTYNVMELRMDVDVHSPMKDLAASADEQKEKQFFTPTTSRLLNEIEKDHFHAQTDRSNTSVKRNIDFLSPTPDFDEDKADPVVTSDGSASVQPLPLDASCPQSPVKKNKDHLKQS